MGANILVEVLRAIHFLEQVVHVQVRLAEHPGLPSALFHGFACLAEDVVYDFLILNEDNKRHLFLQDLVMCLFVGAGCESFDQVEKKAVHVEASWVLQVAGNCKGKLSPGRSRVVPTIICTAHNCPKSCLYDVE